MKKLFLLCTIIAITLASCKSGEKSATSNDKPLQETTWQLTHLYCEEIEKAPEIPTILFKEDGRLSGKMGCNSFFGSYTTHKDKMTLTYNGSTKKLCDNMDLEKKYAQAIRSNITHYVIANDILVLKSKNTEIMRFKAQ